MEQERKWNGRWVWLQSDAPSGRSEHEMVYFRRVFDLLEPERTTLRLFITADSRYRLYINGHSITVGPCKGSSQTHYYESIDVSDGLRVGKNVIAVKVLHYGERDVARGPLSISRSGYGGLLVDGALLNAEGSVIDSLHTDERWRCARDESLQFSSAHMISQWMGACEEVHGEKIPSGWAMPEFDDSSWSAAGVVMRTANPYGILTPWRLSPRPIPLLYEKYTEFQSVKAGTDLTTDKTLFKGTRVTVDFDAGALTTGYPVIEFTGGKGSVIQVLCSESYVQSDETGRRWKGIRDDASGDLVGSVDTYYVAGTNPLAAGAVEVYEPFWFRTFRFVRFIIDVSDESLTISRIGYRETGYPLEVSSEFSCSDSTLGALWDISLNTLARCMHETYEDCPFYEQLQYTMDTMLECLYTYYVSADDRLARRAIHDFHSSLLADGMLQSRYPSIEPQAIPGFALYWISMVHDHFVHYGDLSLVQRYLATVDAVLGWFDQRQTGEGIVGAMPEEYWPFVDWVAGWPEGVPPNGRTQPLTVYNLMYVKALCAAVELNERAGRLDVASAYRQRADKLSDTIRRLAWNEAAGLFQDVPGVHQYSQHAQIWAVLADVITGDTATELMNRTLADTQLSQASYAMKFFLFRALAKSGLYDKTYELWDAWRDMVKLNLTTWVEDPVGQRSDCHGWGAVPLYDFPAEILGVKPGEPGFNKVVVEPKPGPLTWARGVVSTPRGPVSVDWRIEDGQFLIDAQGPAGVPVEIRTPDGFAG